VRERIRLSEVAMSTVNGIGTFYYGDDDRRRDGSQVATLFAVLFFMPLVPLGTHRIKKSAIRGGSMNIQRIESLPLKWDQILLTYLKCWVLTPLLLAAPLVLILLVGKIDKALVTKSVLETFVWVWIVWVIGMATYLLGRVRRA
jgi:hypothetical protein